MKAPHLTPTAGHSRALRNALGTFATGVTIVTARAANGAPIGLTVNSFNSVSLDPPLVAWALALTSPNVDAFREASYFTVNVLTQDQEALSRQFASPHPDRFAGLAVSEGLGGTVLLPECSAWFECRNEATYPGGDHILFIGLVERFSSTKHDPLIYYRGQYRKLAQE